MSTEQHNDDQITDAVLSGSAYERLRACRHSFTGHPLPRLLSLQGTLLALLATTVPLYRLYPDSVASYLSTTDPLTATPRIAMLGAFGGVIVFLAAAMLVGAAVYRLKYAPLTETQARELLVIEDFSGGLTLGMGGPAIVLTVGGFAMGLLGDGAISSYVATTARNPFSTSLYPLPLGVLGAGALAASAVVLVSRWYVGRRLAALGS
jgi:hypothetical protein